MHSAVLLGRVNQSDALTIGLTHPVEVWKLMLSSWKAARGQRSTEWVQMPDFDPRELIKALTDYAQGGEEVSP